VASRAFVSASALDGDALALGLAPALTPAGLDDRPTFFRGFSTHPQVLARGLVTLADITATRYFQFTPTAQRDPVLTAQGDRLRAEVFSACNGVYARLDLLGAGFDGGDIAHGTTNVDIGAATRSALTAIGRHELLHLEVGGDGLAVATLDGTSIERPVTMPDRWVRALGNVAELHRPLTASVHADAVQARRFVTALPAVTSAGRDGWISLVRGELKVGPRATPGSVHVAGLHRLGATKRLLTHLRGMTLYGPADGTRGVSAAQFELPDARLVIGLTDESWRGHSGEGSLLASLSAPGVVEDAELVSALLAFEPVIDIDQLARDGGLDAERVRGALAVLAASGRVGWDLHDAAWFHRELPDDPARVEKDNPRLVAARILFADGAVSALDGVTGTWQVGGSAAGHRVRTDSTVVGGYRCTCTWFLKHAGGRGPCKHVLAVRMERGEIGEATGSATTQEDDPT
jgi:hypothetical protein